MDLAAGARAPRPEPCRSGYRAGGDERTRCGRGAGTGGRSAPVLWSPHRSLRQPRAPARGCGPDRPAWDAPGRGCQVRSAAAGELGRLDRDPATITRLLDVAGRDASFAVRQSALVAAGRLKPDQALEVLKPFLQMDSPHQQMRAATVQALDRPETTRPSPPSWNSATTPKTASASPP